jgi:predicted branched-subunit amino acid permease
MSSSSASSRAPRGGAARRTPSKIVRILLVLVALLVGVIVGLVAGILDVATGSTIPGAVATGAVTFAGAVSLAILLQRALDLL